MPPKAKKPDANKNQGPIEDETGIPKNEVSFKFSFEVKQNEVADILIMFEWVSSTDSNARQKLDTELIECWNQKTPEDPTVVNYELELPSFLVEDKFVKNLCADKFYVHFVSAEDQCVKDTLSLHYSPILTAKGGPKFEFFYDKVKIPEIEYFQLTLTADKELLLPLYRDYLNPLEICIVGAKEMPNPNPGYNKYEPVYVQAKFYDGTVIKTYELAHGSTCKWMYKQVILAGLMDPIKLKEDLKSVPLTFEIHDQDEVAKNNIREFKQLVDVKYEDPEPPAEAIDPKAKGGKGAAAAAAKKKEPEKKEEKPKDAKAKDAKDAKGKKEAKKKKDVKTFEPIKAVDTREFIRLNYGLSNFNLNDLLNPHVNALKIRNYIVPLQRFESKDAKNLDLNTTARKELQERHAAGDYMSSESYLVVTFELAHGIRPFKKPSQPAQDSLNLQQTEVRPKSKVGGPDAKAAAQKVDPKKKGAVQAEVEAPKVEVVDEKPIYERAVYILPYKSPELTTKLLSFVNHTNMSAFGLADGNQLFLTTKVLSEEERNNKNLDIITGLEFIDTECRIFILEGLSDKAMKRLEEEFPKTQPNSREVKIFKNVDIKFKSRLYLDFNIDLRKIKLRENLSKLLMKADIYLRSKVPEHIYHILVNFNELRKCETLKAVIASNLFPDVNNLVAMERKYGDALTDEDVSGKEGSPKRVIKRPDVSKIGTELGLSLLGSGNTTRGNESGSKRLVDVTQSDEKLPEISTHGPRSMSLRLATKVEKVKHDKYSLHMTQPYPSDGEVFTQAGAKLNIYEKQKAELREIVRNDPNHFYTYSADYLSQSIDPFTTDEVKRIDEEYNKKMWKTKEGFQTILRKTKNDYIVHPKKPHHSKIDDLHTNPWYQSKLAETTALVNTRGEPIRNGPDFNLQIPGIKFFSTPQVFEEEKITNVEKERRLREAKKKAEDEWKAKMKVDNPYFYTSLCMDRNSQLDKIKGIREGEAVKKGLLMKDTRLKTTTLGMTKTVQENPISLYLEEGWIDNATKNLFERQVNTAKAVSPYDFKTNTKQAYQHGLVYKPMKMDVFQ